MSFHTAAQRREQQRSDARRALLAAAESILVEDGYDQFSMRRLAERCGYTAPTIYHDFGDKLGLLDAVLETRFRELLQAIRVFHEFRTLLCISPVSIIENASWQLMQSVFKIQD